MGKTCLMRHFYQQARTSGFLCAHLRLESGYTNVSSVLDTMKQQLGGGKAFPASQQVVQKHAAHNVKIDVKDVSVEDRSQLFLQTAKDDHSLHMRRSELTDAFLEDVARLERRKNKLFLLDALDKAEPDVRHWVQDHLLVGLHRLDHIFIVLAGREEPTLQPPWESVCHLHRLEPVTVSDYWDYCQQINLALPRETIGLLHAVFKGSPGEFFDNIPVVRSYQQGHSQ